MRIKDICKEKNISTDDLAQRIETTLPYIYNIDNEKANPTLKMLKKIAGALDVQVTELFDEPKAIYNCPHCGKPVTVKLEK